MGANAFLKKKIYIFLLSSPTFYGFDVLFYTCGPKKEKKKNLFGVPAYLSGLLSNCNFLFPIDSCFFSI